MAQKVSPRLDWKDIRASASKFAIKYKDAKKESSLKQSFWIDFFKIFGLDPNELGAFEYYVSMLNGTGGEIDYFWPGKVIIEHKSAGKNLDNAEEQVFRYLLAIDDYNATKKQDREKIAHPEYIVVSDFQRIRLINLKQGHSSDNVTIQLKELPEYIDLFAFLAGSETKARIVGEHPINTRAAMMMGRIYDDLIESNYPEDEIDELLIRLVFCMFAEDSEIFERNQFTNYVFGNSTEDGLNFGSLLNDLFTVLDTEESDRQKRLPQQLLDFPYVNGGLFARRLTPAAIDRDIRDRLYRTSDMDWKHISPAIFGSLFQSIMNPDLRRALGAHYTSEENILKLIDPLFMDDLREELRKAGHNRSKLEALWSKIERIRVFDPACGCGNFLIIAYRELRHLEMDLMDAFGKGQTFLQATRLNIDHFYGIEYERFPALIANISILLMEHLLNLESRSRFGLEKDIIPLREKANIIQADSLETDWADLVDPMKLTYILGNPPFVGAKLQSEKQRDQMASIFAKNGGVLDYVSAWYKKASDFMGINPSIRTAFVSTNSITQGEQVEPLWRPIFESGCRINFAYRTFKWMNEAKGVAAVHVIIVGFSHQEVPCRIFTHSDGLTGDIIETKARHINAYLVDGPDTFLPNRVKPISNVPTIETGCQPIDDGNYLFSEEEKIHFINSEPKSEKYFHPWIGSKEFISGERKFCLWLGNCPPSELRAMPSCLQRVDNVRKFRMQSKRKQTIKCADTPTHFYLENIPKHDYLVIPETSSERRNYIPIGLVDSNTFCSNAVRMMPNATSYEFGILTSKMHMVWVNHVCGRLKSDYRYSVGIVYNNFPWPNPTDVQRKRIEDAAKQILETRDRYPGQSYADLYDPLTMPKDLLKAHQKLDREVDRAYRDEPFRDDGDRMSYLFGLYNDTTGE